MEVRLFATNGQVAIGYRVRLAHQRRCPFKLRQAKSWGQGSGQPKRRPTDKETLVGVSNEVTIEIEHFTCSALIDTGATVSVKIRPRLLFA